MAILKKILKILPKGAPQECFPRAPLWLSTGVYKPARNTNKKVTKTYCNNCLNTNNIKTKIA